MVLKRRAPARRWASAAVSSGSTATGATWGWRERKVKVRSSATAASASSATSSAPRTFFIVREGGATALARQGAPSDDTSIDYTPVHDPQRRLRRRAVFPYGPHGVRQGDLLDRRLSRRWAARGFGPAEPRPRRATAGR